MLAVQIEPPNLGERGELEQCSGVAHQRASSHSGSSASRSGRSAAAGTDHARCSVGVGKLSTPSQRIAVHPLQPCSANRRGRVGGCEILSARAPAAASAARFPTPSTQRLSGRSRMSPRLRCNQLQAGHSIHRRHRLQRACGSSALAASTSSSAVRAIAVLRSSARAAATDRPRLHADPGQTPRSPSSRLRASGAWARAVTRHRKTTV